MIVTVEGLLQQLRTDAQTLTFADVLAVIGQHCRYTPTRFTNGLGEHKLINEPGTNEGSCQVFGFALLHGLSQDDTLKLFAEHYRSVLAEPHGVNHANIRMFMRFGWDGICFDGEPLALRATR